MEWRSLDTPSSRDWWALEERGERLALLQPFEGRISIRFYTGIEPWKTKDVSAATMDQAKRYAWRWVQARRK
jgi:hypothetical protein